MLVKLRRFFSMCATAALIAGPAVASDHHARTASHPDPLSRTPQCPRQALPVTRDAVARAADAALREAPRIYRGTNRRGMRVVVAVLETSRRAPKYALVKCGRRAHRRTVFVELHFPAMRPSASLSQGRVQVSRFRDGWHVWNVFH